MPAPPPLLVSIYRYAFAILGSRCIKSKRQSRILQRIALQIHQALPLGRSRSSRSSCRRICDTQKTAHTGSQTLVYRPDSPRLRTSSQLRLCLISVSSFQRVPSTTKPWPDRGRACSIAFSNQEITVSSYTLYACQSIASSTWLTPSCNTLLWLLGFWMVLLNRTH